MSQESKATIESLDQEGRGISHVEGKTIFIEGALPGERVAFKSFHRKPRYEQAVATAILSQSALRVAPRCPHFGVCGGCSMQHLDATAQTAIKQRVLEDALWHLARLRPEVLYPAIQGPAWRYRSRARLGVRWVAKKGGILVGFHERRSSFIADMDCCEVLPEKVSRLLPKMRTLVASLSVRERLPQIEVAIGEDGIALVLRHLQALNSQDQQLLRAFAASEGVTLYLQPGGPQSIALFHPPQAALPRFRLAEFDVEFEFGPSDFTQVNLQVNRVLLRRALGLLQPAPGERVADMFCGIGNFALPLARAGAQVLGIEGNAAAIARARHNAERNGLTKNTEFRVANLFEATDAELAAFGRCQKMLIDPPREGAATLVKGIEQMAPARIVYVSCNPATLARDAAILVHEKGYQMRGAGVANMFPQTSHVESIALFEKDPP